MSAALPVADAPVVSVAGAIARMEAIASVLPAADGLACFNRMYLDVTRQVNSQLGQGFFADPAFMTQLDVAFANLYFAAADTATTPAAVPLAWRPLAEQRAVAGIEPVQFALAGMNAHINHDLPIAMVSASSAAASRCRVTVIVSWLRLIIHTYSEVCFGQVYFDYACFTECGTG